MEKKSDEEVMKTLQSFYGHLNGGTKLFEISQQIRVEVDGNKPNEFLSTSPLDENRIKNFLIVAKKNGWSEKGKFTLLPVFFKNHLIKDTIPSIIHQ